MNPGRHGRVPVFLSSEDVTPGLQANQAFTDRLPSEYGTRYLRQRYRLELLDAWLVHVRRCKLIVFVSAGVSREAQEELALHELGHAALWFKRFRRTAAQEEAVIYEHAPPMRDMLHALGFRWPKRPRGMSALERHAQRVVT